jgi:hypothetical protein
MSNPVKIVIDADVIIHFMKGDSLTLLPKIYPQYKFVILDELLNKELRNNQSTRLYLDNIFIHFPNLISIEKWVPNYEMIKELSKLTTKYGYGESLSLVYCKFHNDVIASSNITEITNYCEENDIQYITTMDFIWQAFKIQLISEDECNSFLQKVIDKKSKLPCRKITDYKPRTLFL